MTLHVKEEFTISEKLKDVFMEMEVSPVGVLKNYALNLVYNKIHQYEAENGLFEKKFGCKQLLGTLFLRLHNCLSGQQAIRQSS